MTSNIIADITTIHNSDKYKQIRALLLDQFTAEYSKRNPNIFTPVLFPSIKKFNEMCIYLYFTDTTIEKINSQMDEIYEFIMWS